MIVNDNPAELANLVIAPGPEVTDADTDNEALSKTIFRIRKELVAEKVKTAKLKQVNEELVKERSNLRKKLAERNERIAKLTSKKVSKKEKMEMLDEILKESSFTDV